MENLSSIDLKYSKSLLAYLLENGESLKKNLSTVIRNWNTLEQVLKALQQDGLITVTEEIAGRRQYKIKLTERGKAVAEQLKKVDLISKIPPEDLEKYKRIHVLEHFNVYEDHVTLTDRSLEGVRYVNIYARPKGDLLYFWCDVDKDVDCYHIGYLFVDEKLRNFIKEQLEKNGFKLPKIYQKYVDEYW